MFKKSETKLIVENWRRFINESTSREKINDEAWELVGNGLKNGKLNPEIETFVKERLGLKEYLPNDKNFESKINALTDQMIELIRDEKILVKEVSYKEIINFKNLENPTEKEHGLLNQAHEINLSNDSVSDKCDAYDELMKYRDDLGGGRIRPYGLKDLFNLVVSKENYPLPLVIKINNNDYVIGGRTRIYAAVAAGVSIKIYYLDSEQLKSLV